MNRFHVLLGSVLWTALAAGQELNCDLAGYKAQDGLKAQMRDGALELTWHGERQNELRAAFTVRGGQPVVQELAVRKPGGAWMVLGRNLTPEFELTSGVRRLSDQQMEPMKELGIELTPEVVEREKWNAFWDAPLMVPGRPGTNLGLPRKPEEIRRASAEFHASGCQVKIGRRAHRSGFPGMEAGIFCGQLQYTVYRGTNLLRQEAIAKTNEPSVAYKYNGGLKGFAITDRHAHGLAGHRARLAAVRIRRRRSIRIQSGCRPATAWRFWKRAADRWPSFRPRTNSSSSREIETNLGYVYYRKDSETALRHRRAAAGSRGRTQAVGHQRCRLESAGRRVSRRPQ